MVPELYCGLFKQRGVRFLFTLKAEFGLLWDIHAMTKLLRRKVIKMKHLACVEVNVNATSTQPEIPDVYPNQTVLCLPLSKVGISRK